MTTFGFFDETVATSGFVVGGIWAGSYDIRRSTRCRNGLFARFAELPDVDTAGCPESSRNLILSRPTQFIRATQCRQGLPRFVKLANVTSRPRCREVRAHARKEVNLERPDTRERHVQDITFTEMHAVDLPPEEMK